MYELGKELIKLLNLADTNIGEKGTDEELKSFAAVFSCPSN